MTRSISIYLKDILTNMGLAEKFIEKITYEEFSKDTKTSYAVLRCLEIIGEATKNIPDEFRSKYPEIPWKDMAGMRDKVIHSYSGLNLQRIWATIKESIPKLKPEIQKILEKTQ